MANRYWVGGTASWDGTAGSKWATTSGGAGGAAVPTSADDVFFDGTSGAVTVTISSSRVCRSLNATGFTGTLAGSGALSVGDASGGSFTLSSGMTYSHSGTITFVSTTTGNTITLAGKDLNHNVVFNGVGGAWAFQDTFTANSVDLTAGAVTTNNHDVNIDGFATGSGSSVRSIDFGTSVITITGGGSVWTVDTGTNETVTINNATIQSTIGFIQFYLGAYHYKAINLTPGVSPFQSLRGTGTIDSVNLNGVNACTFKDGLTIGALKIDAGSVIKFDNNTVTILNSLTALGSIGNTITMQVETSGTWNITSTAALINCDYLILSNSAASGGTTFYAGANSTNSGGNSGWSFTSYSPPDIGVPLATLTIAGYIPIVETSNDTIIGTPLGHLTLTTPLELISIGVKVDAPLKTLTMTGPTHAVYLGTNVLSVLASLDAAPYATVSSFTKNVPLIECDIAGPIPVVSCGVNIFSELGELTTTPYSPAYENPIVLHVRPPVGVLSLTGNAASISSGKNIAVPVSTMEMTSGAGFFILNYVQFNGDPIPADHMEDALKLEADGYVDLFQIILPDGMSKIFLKQNQTIDWQGDTYEGTGIKIEGVGNYADDTVSRPKVTIFNPNGVYSYLVDQGLLDSASIARYRVLKEHIIADLPIYRRQQWKVTRISSVKSTFISLELRDMLDGQNFLTPGRMFIPPDFPTVSLS